MQNRLLAGAFVVLWSSGFIGAVLAAKAGSVAGTLAWRYLITALALLLLITARRRLHSAAIRQPSSQAAALTTRALAQQATLGLLAHVVFLGGVFGSSSAGVDAGTAALVCALQPMLVAAAGSLAWGDRLALVQIVGLGLGLVAVVITVDPGGTGGLGVVLPVASLLGLSLAALLERRWRPELDVLTSLTVQVLVATACFVAFAVLTDELAVDVSVRFVAAVVWLVVLSGLGGYAAFIGCLRRLGATSTSALLYLTPPVTTLWAWAMFGQHPAGAQLLGLALGAVAVLLVLGAGPSRTDKRASAVVS